MSQRSIARERRVEEHARSLWSAEYPKALPIVWTKIGDALRSRYMNAALLHELDRVEEELDELLGAVA